MKEIWESKQLSNNGSKVRQLECRLADYMEAEHLSVFSNGTLALLIACKLLELSGEVITTPFTFPATVNALAWNRLTPVFCDIDEKNFNINPDLIEPLITERTTAILPVHVFGIPCDVYKIQRIADRYGLKVLYDAAHAFGVKYSGKAIASFGDISMFSFHATKVYNTIEGGALVFNDPALKARADEMRNFGLRTDGDITEPGINAKMNEVQAAVGLLLLDKVGGEIEKRGILTAAYAELLSDIPGIGMNSPAPGVQYNYPYCAITVDKDAFGLSRDELYEKLEANRVFARKYFYPLCSNLQCYSRLPSSDKSRLPCANRVAESVLAPPLYGELAVEDVRFICDIIRAGHSGIGVRQACRRDRPDTEPSAMKREDEKQLPESSPVPEGTAQLSEPTPAKKPAPEGIPAAPEPQPEKGTGVSPPEGLSHLTAYNFSFVLPESAESKTARGNPPYISFIAFNRLGLTIRNLDKLLDSDEDFELHIIDSHSKDNSWDYILRLTDPRIKSKIRFDRNYGPIYALNYALSRRKPDQYFITVDSDTYIKTKNWIARFMEVFDAFPDVGLLGLMRDNPYPRFLPPIIPRVKGEAAYLELKNADIDAIMDFIPGQLQCLSPRLLKEIGYWSEENGFGDAELSPRIVHHTLFKVGFITTIEIDMTQRLGCNECRGRDICTLSRSVDDCFSLGKRFNKNESFVEKNTWKFRQTFEDLREGRRTAYCASVHDPESRRTHVYHADWAAENMDFYIRNAN
jgi:dTDP-4-amino-4,6-dideoxygalactose transaminase